MLHLKFGTSEVAENLETSIVPKAKVAKKSDGTSSYFNCKITKPSFIFISSLKFMQSRKKSHSNNCHKKYL